MPTVPQIFIERADRTPDTPAFHVRDGDDLLDLGTPEGGGWRAYTLRTAVEVISGLTRVLAEAGVGPGVPVAILAETSHAWVAVDVAVLALGGITVGIYPSLTGPQIAFQLSRSRAQVLIVDDAPQHDKLDGASLPDLRQVFTLRDAPGLTTLRPGRADLLFLRERAARVSLDDIATYVFTSGTTADPKAAILTHRNFSEIIEASRQRIPTRPGDRSIVFLPLAHSLQRFTLYRGVSESATGWFSRIPDLQATLPVARPHVLASVPRMLEKIKAGIEAQAAARGPRAAAFLHQAVEVGRERRRLEQAGRPIPLGLRARHALADRLVYRRVRAGLGGHLRTFISGGAALSVEVAEWYEALGIMVREGWGLTETCAPACVNSEQDYRLGTIGKPLPGVELRLAEDGELLVRGPGNFKGYLDDPQATAEAFDEQGFFRTGDLGTIDADGFVRIVDRKKALIVTAGGKNIAPVPIEKRLEGGVIAQAIVIGSERPYLIALLVPDPQALRAMAEARGWEGDATAWIQRDELRTLAQAQVTRANHGRARFETIKRFALVWPPFSVERDELTPTLKLRRRDIIERHAATIESTYAAPGH